MASSTEERLAVLETRVGDLKENIEGMNDKLDTLLALRNKGAGVFWLISALFGTSVIGLMTWMIDSVRGH